MKLFQSVAIGSAASRSSDREATCSLITHYARRVSRYTHNQSGIVCARAAIQRRIAH